MRVSGFEDRVQVVEEGVDRVDSESWRLGERGTTLTEPMPVVGQPGEVALTEVDPDWRPGGPVGEGSVALGEEQSFKRISVPQSRFSLCEALLDLAPGRQLLEDFTLAGELLAEDRAGDSPVSDLLSPLPLAREVEAAEVEPGARFPPPGSGF